MVRNCRKPARVAEVGGPNMTDTVTSHGEGARHLTARQMAEQAIAAEGRGDADEAERLFATADRIDPAAVIAVLQERAAGTPPNRPTEEQDDEEVAAMFRTVQPHSAAPSRAGVSGRGSGADNQD